MYQLNLKTNVSKLTLGIALATLSTSAFSAGIDRTGQDIRSFFTEGNYAEVDFVYIETDISGVDHKRNTGIVPIGSDFEPNNSTGNITGESTFLTRYGVKADINDNMTVGVFYDQPFGANVRFEEAGNFVSNEDQDIALEVVADNKDTPEYDPTIGLVKNGVYNEHLTEAGYDKHTSSKIESESLTGLIGLKSNGIQIYGGPVAQKFKMETHLRGNATGPLTGYDLNIAKSTAYGWAAGVSYSIPAIKLNAALTYRSEIEHEARFNETVPIMDPQHADVSVKLSGLSIDKNVGNVIAGKIKTNTQATEDFNITESTSTKATVTTPSSVNFNFQTGLSEKHQLLGTLNARWVPWSTFKIVPPYYNTFSKANYPDGLPLLSYKEDQYSVDVGLAKRFTDRLAASAVVGFDSGAGEETSSLGPVNGMWSVGGGVKYNLTDEFAVTAGGKYMFLGNATGVLPTGNTVNKAADNTGFAGVVKLSYQED